MAVADFTWADGLRRTHFPPERNQVPAHITLFHHLPPSAERELLDRVKRMCAGPPPGALLDQVRHLGQGVAFSVNSPELLAIRETIADSFHGLLTAQDRGTPRLHITVQNKVSAETSRALAETLRADFKPRPIAIAGLATWRYLGGPWKLIRETRFRG